MCWVRRQADGDTARALRRPRRGQFGESPSDARVSWRRVPGIEVVRDGRTIPLLPTPAAFSSPAVHWDGMALEVLHVSPGVIPDHEHATHAVHLITNGPVRPALIARPGVYSGPLGPQGPLGPHTIVLMPRGSRHRLLTEDPIATVSVALDPHFVSRALEATAAGAAIELTPRRNLTDPHVTSMLLALCADLEGGSPAGRLYGESLGTALSVGLARRYGAPVAKKIATACGRLSEPRRDLVFLDARGRSSGQLGLPNPARLESIAHGWVMSCTRQTNLPSGAYRDAMNSNRLQPRSARRGVVRRNRQFRATTISGL